MRDIPREIDIYLDEISERLGSGRAVAMIGAGFSKNAVKVVPTEKQFLNWNELGDVFYKKIYRKSAEDVHERYLDAVKLASIVENIFGRTVLDKLLLDYLPDEEFSPGELHKRLLSLNWVDIFTTNYDTLLERTRKFIPNRRYQAVLRMEDLVYSSCPRIIKLHGSFPSYRPFVISQEDYRRYPKDFAIFVNTVQQALIENILCLIGFSGDDPNFLNWIGWIRDNLGANYNSKIYLITVDHETRVENILLSARNIVVVNLADCFPKREVSHQKALEFFFEELQKRQGDSEKRKWLEATKGVELGRLHEMEKQEKQKELLLELYKFWNDSRQNYPGWIIAPHRERIFLEKSLSDSERYGVWDILEKLKNISSISEDLPSMETFAELYDWIRQVCLLPLTDKMSSIYEKILETTADDSLKCELMISLLTYYRRTGATERFCKQKKRLLAEQRLTEEQKQRIRCERAIFFLYQCEYEEMDRELSEWPLDVGNFNYELMHIGLMWEGEQYRQGLSMLVTMLDGIRGIEGSSMDLKILSQEAYILNLLKRVIPQAEFLSLNEKPIKFILKNYYIEGNREEILRAERCDPENEMELFRIALTYQEVPEKQEELYYTSAQFVNFLERTGNFMVVSSKMEYKEELKRAIEQIIRHNFYWGMVLSIRTRDDQFIRQMIGRGALHISNEEADCISNHFCEICKKHIFFVAGSRNFEIKGHRSNIWGDYMPIVLGELIHRCKAETRKRILGLAWKMVEIQKAFGEFSFLLKNVYRCLDGTFMVKNWEKLLELVMKAENEEYPFDVSALDFCDFMLYDMKQVKEQITDIFCKRVEYLREVRGNWAGVMCVKAFLYYIGVFDETRKKQFILDVKNNIEKVEFSLDFYSYIFEIVKETKNLILEVKKWIVIKVRKILTYVNFDSEECIFLIQLFEKTMRIFNQYQFNWSIHDIQELIDCLENLEKIKSSIKREQYYLLFSNYCQLLIDMLWNNDCRLLHKNFRKIKAIYEKNKKYRNEWKYLEFTKKLLCTENISDVKDYIFDGVYGMDEKYFIIAICVFQKYLQKDTDKWKNYLKEVEISLFVMIREQGILAPFCIESIGTLVKNRKSGIGEMDVLILQKILDIVYKLEIKSDFLLLQKAYGASLAYECSTFAQNKSKLKACIKKWKAYVGQEEVHTLIKKKWGTC